MTVFSFGLVKANAQYNQQFDNIKTQGVKSILLSVAKKIDRLDANDLAKLSSVSHN
jgi:hypothetical protein